MLRKTLTRCERQCRHSETEDSEEHESISSGIEYSIVARAPQKAEKDGRSWPARVALMMIGFYKMAISPMLPPSCRFEPTCSQYTYQAIERFGLRRGGRLGIKRLMRCRPFGPCGSDPVPDLDSLEPSGKNIPDGKSGK